MRFRLALATKPGDVFFLCEVPTQNMDNTWNMSNLEGCEKAKTLWTKATSRKGEGSRKLQDYICPGPGSFRRTQLADTVARRTDRACLRRSHDRNGRPPGACCARSVRSSHCREQELRHDRRLSTSNTRSQTADFPNVLCMVAYVLNENLQHVRTIRMWRGEFGSTPPFDIGPDALFVAYSAWAEMTCFKVLGWQFPVHIFDLHTAYLAASNILLPYNPDEVRKRPRKRLSDACRAYGIEGWERIDKDDDCRGHRRRPLARIRPGGCLRLLRRRRDERR